MPRRRQGFWKLTDDTFDLIGAQWNITYAQELIALRAPADQEPSTRLNITPDLDPWLPDRETGKSAREGTLVVGCIRINREYALSAATDLTKPVLLVRLNGGAFPIDGWHRLYKARHEGIESLPAHLLTEAEEKLVRR